MKCLICRFVPGHTFKDCKSVNCECGCANNLAPNKNAQELSDNAPKWLDISVKECKKLKGIGCL